MKSLGLVVSFWSFFVGGSGGRFVGWWLCWCVYGVAMVGLLGFFCCWFTMDLWVVVGGGNGGVCGTTVVGWWRCWTLFVVGVSYWICGLTSGSGVCGVAMVGWWVWQQWLLGWNFWC